jgi:MFS family permease
MRLSGLAVVLGAFLVVFGVGGVRLIFGVWVRPLEDEFQVDRSTISLLGALSLLIFGLGQPIMGRLVDVHGPRLIVPGTVLLSGLGVVAASQMPSLIGFALVFMLLGSVGFAGAANATVASMVVQRFERNRSLIYGICSAGGPLGALALAGTTASGIETFGWRMTMLALGIVILMAIFPITVLLIGRPQPTPATTREPLPSFLDTCRLMFRSRGFVYLFLAYFCCGVTTLGLVHTHIVAYGQDRGLASVAAAEVLGLIGLFNVAGLVLSGRIADRWGGRRPLIGAFMLRACALLWLTTADSGTELVVFAVLFGLTDMATIPASAAAASEMFGPRMLGALVGLLVVSHQVGAALGSYLAGVGYELLGGYPPVILATVGVALSAAILCFAMDTRPILAEPSPGDEASLVASGA